MNPDHIKIAQETIARIAVIADNIANQANVGGMETAGSIVSYLARHPDQLEALLTDGVFATEHDLPHYAEQGCLSWHAQNGKIVSPEWMRRKRIIDQMEAHDV